MALESKLKKGIVTEAHGTERLRTRSFRRESDRFLYNLNEEMYQAQTIAQSIHTVLTALENRNYVAPRVYRKNGSKENEYILIDILGLPRKAMKNKDKLRVTPHPFLEEIIAQHQIYHNDLAKSDPAVQVESNDPLNYIAESGLICVPYSRRSEILNKTIQGLLVVSYDPKLKIINNEELRVLDQVSWFVADNVTRLLELDQFRKLNEKLLLQTKIDGPTGLYNKETFHQDLKRYFTEAKTQTKTAPKIPYLMLIDLDHFKSVNDTVGHAEGDRLIVEVGNILHKFAPNTAYRVGNGDEFAILTYISSQQEIYTLATSLQHAIFAIPLPSECQSVTSSIGILKNSPSFTSAEQWYRATDLKLYEAKRRRNCIVFNQ